MAILWNDERLTLDQTIEILRDEHRRWLETANAFARLKPYISGTFSSQDAEASMLACRTRAHELEKLISHLQAQTILRPTSPESHQSGTIQ